MGNISNSKKKASLLLSAVAFGTFSYSAISQGATSATALKPVELAEFKTGSCKSVDDCLSGLRAQILTNRRVPVSEVNAVLADAKKALTYALPLYSTKRLNGQTEYNYPATPPAGAQATQYRHSVKILGWDAIGSAVVGVAVGAAMAC